MLETVVIEPEQPAQGAVIFLHGLGADGHDFEPIVPELGVDDLQLRFIFPHAPERPITINEGEPLRAWYDFVPHSEHAGSDDIKASALNQGPPSSPDRYGNPTRAHHACRVLPRRRHGTGSRTAL